MSFAYRDIKVSDDSDNSDEECLVWKRAVKKADEKIVPPIIKTPEQQTQLPLIQQSKERKKNTIWCEVLQDQLISEDLEDCLLKNKPRDYGSRGKESYDYTLRYTDPRCEKDSDSSMSDSAIEEEPPKSKSKHTVSFRNEGKKFVKLNSAELTAARRINKVLHEKKFYLIQRIVKTVGIEKAMNLLSMTEEIEENGGMMVNNNKRRRTAGGVYIQLLKNDKSVTQEMLDKIFEGEMSPLELKKFYAEQKKNKKKKKRQQKKPKLDESKARMNIQMQEADEMDAMDAEISDVMNYEKSSLDNNPAPICNQNAAERSSDLEEGEIDD